jgi:hypothetical protein
VNTNPQGERHDLEGYFEIHTKYGFQALEILGLTTRMLGFSPLWSANLPSRVNDMFLLGPGLRERSQKTFQKTFALYRFLTILDWEHRTDSVGSVPQ